VIRITVSVADSILSRVDEGANKKGISRSQYVADAVEAYISGGKQVDEALINVTDDLHKSQSEVMQLKRQITNLNNQLTEKDKKIESLTIDAKNRDDQIKQAYEKLHNSEKEIIQYKSALEAKEDEVAFLRSHISQLTQQISPPALPGVSEGRKWWKFW